MDLSIVIPVYNEEDSLPSLYDKITDSLNESQVSFEIIFVNDGSTDRTLQVLKTLNDRDRRVKAISFRRNYGQTAAMAAGFDHARGDIIVSMDGDLQNDPADIPRLLAELERGKDVVCGWRKNRQDKFLSRRVPSVAANWLIGLITGIRIHDNGCSLKAFRASVIKNVALYGEMHRFIPAMSTMAGARIAEIVVNHHPRRFGKSKYGIGRIWRVILDIISVKMIIGFASRPAVWFGLLSIPVFIFTLFTLAWAVGMLLNRLSEEWFVLSSVTLLSLSLSVHLLSMGIIAELSMKSGDYQPQSRLNTTEIP
jgi:glycosyltransferase involved in cell wall biosynthesis